MSVAEAIPALLADVPDPDTALNYFERLTKHGEPDLYRCFEKNRALVHYALIVFGYSQYLGETLLQNNDLFHSLIRETSLDRAPSQEEMHEAFARFRSRSFEADIAQLLVRFKRREYIRIMLRDVLGLATLSEVTSEISALSDVLIQEALRECESVMHAKYGMPLHRDSQGKWAPTPFSILALGKLGGNELNYSSDVDLMFLYGDGEDAPDAAITNREYFIRLGQLVTDVLSRVTKDGFVFRIDLRLRPQGREGESAISAGQALRYYIEYAHDWERQALIKVRHCAGNVLLARQFIRQVQEHIYKEQVNFSAIETALKARDRIRQRRRMAPREGIDVKLDQGGIRDIEFLVQCLQRVYGGKEKWLRSGGTLFSLQKLHDKQHISGNDFHELTAAYEFLRAVEHRLQLRRWQQTHRVPAEVTELAILARSLHQDAITPANIEDVIRERMDKVRVIYERTIHHQQQHTEEQVTEEFQLRAMDLSFGRVHSDHQILQQIAAENSALYEVVSRGDLEPHTRRNLFRFLSSALTSAERYAPVAAAPELLKKALVLFRLSELLTNILVQHPEEIAHLGDLRQVAPCYPPGLFDHDALPRTSWTGALEDYLSSNGLTWGEKLACLRRRYRYRIFLSGARDILRSRPVFASLADTSDAAEEAISAAFAMTGIEGMSVMALGRLGTREFDSLSDADLLFIRKQNMDAGRAEHAVEKIVHALSAYTNEGTVFVVDARLRPYGTDGALTVTPDQLTSYFASEAQGWEALTYTKLRFIAGDADLAQQAKNALGVMYIRFGADREFASEVRRMRAKLERTGDPENMKTGIGGLYDIDFLIGYLLVRSGIRNADGNTRQRLQQLAQAALIDSSEAQVLIDAVDFWRTLEHVTRLASGKAQKVIPISQGGRRAVIEMIGEVMGPDVAEQLEIQARDTRSSVRRMFNAVLGRCEPEAAS